LCFWIDSGSDRFQHYHQQIKEGDRASQTYDDWQKNLARPQQTRQNFDVFSASPGEFIISFRAFTLGFIGSVKTFFTSFSTIQALNNYVLLFAILSLMSLHCNPLL
jgi:hypothetical protein